MPTIDEIRQAYPQYSDLSDEQLLSGLHRRFYSDMPFDAFASRIAPAKQPEAPERGLLGTIGARAGDIAGSVVSGVGGIASGIGGLAGIAGAGFDNRFITAGRGIQEYGESLMSPELQEKRRALSEAIKAAEDQGLAAEASAALRTLASNPGLLAAMVVEQIPQFVVSGGIGRGAMAAGQIAGRTGARAAVVGAERAGAEAGARAGTAAAITTGAGLQGGEVAGQAFQDVMNIPAETLARSPAYQELLKEMTPDDARAALANRAGREAGLMGASISAGTMAALPGAEKALFTQNISRRAVSRVLGTAAGEATQEAIEEGGGQVAQNIAALRADVERDLTRGAAGAAATGAVLGGIMGAGTGALARPNVPPAQPPAAPPAAPPAPPTAGQPAPPPAAPPAPPAAGPTAPPVAPAGPVPPVPPEVEAQPTPQVTPSVTQQPNPEYAAWEARRAEAVAKITRAYDSDNTPAIGANGNPLPPMPRDIVIKMSMRDWDRRNPAPPQTIQGAAPEIIAPAPVLPEAPAAPEPTSAPPPLFNVPVGTTFPVITPAAPGGGVMGVDVRPEVVDLYDLVEATGSLQNRNINAIANRAMIESIANKPDFRQLGTSQYADRGSPVVGPDNVIEVGNHRVKGLKLAAERNPEGFNDYVKSLNEAGYDTTGIKFPVLVRRRVSDLDENDRIRFVKAANKPPSQELSAIEQAKDDAVSLTPQLMAQFDGTLNEGIDAAKNKGFVRAFASALVGKTELNKFLKDNGDLSDAGRDRINRALFAAAYQDQTLLEKAINTRDDDLKSITGAMINVVGPMQQLRREIETGRVRPEFDIIPAIVSASDRLRSMKARGLTPEGLLTTEDVISPISPLEAQVIRLMSNDNLSKVASKAAITRRLKEFADIALAQSTQPDMIGKESPLTPEDAVRLAINPGQATMFSKAPAEEAAKAAPQKVQLQQDPYSYWSEYFRAPVVYEDGEIALVEAVNWLSGRPVYVGVLPSGIATKVDVDNYKGALVKPHLLEKMREKKREYLEGVQKKTSGNFRGPFAPGRNIAFDVNFPERLRGFAEGLVDTLGLGDAQILFTDINGAESPDFGPRNNLYGNFFSARTTSFIQDRFGSVFGLSNSMRDRNFYVVSIDANRRLSIQIETLAHEIGHVFDKKVLREADPATFNQIMSSFEDWLKKNGNLPAPQYIQALRTAVVGKKIAPSYANLNAKQLEDYYRRFEEWFADQVARWSLTSKPAQSLIGRFFQRIAAAYRKIVSALGAVGLPDQTVANFIEDHRQRQLPKAYPAKDIVATQGWTKKPKQMTFDLSARGMPEQKITSADTSVKQIPATFKRVDFVPGTVNLDYGGGRFDLGSDFMREKGVENLVYDVFNRSQEHNDGVLSRVREQRPDTVTVNNVLNVVAEPEVRDFIIQDAGQYMKPDGTAYFLIYQGDESGVGKQTAKGFQNNAKAESYIPAIKKHFNDVTRKGNLIIARDFKRGVEGESVVEASRAPRASETTIDPNAGYNYSGYDGVKGLPRTSVERRIVSAIDAYESGRIAEKELLDTLREFAELSADYRRAIRERKLFAERQRGANIVREKLLAAARRGDIEPDAAEFVMWALSKNPQLAANLGIGVREQKAGDQPALGFYVPQSEIMFIMKGGYSPDTAIHEIMHHAERMMPENIQEGIRKEWAKALSKAIKSAPEKQKAILAKVPDAVAGNENARREIDEAINSGDLDVGTYYEFINPSEYWAVNSTRILRSRYDANSWQEKARQWLSEMVQKLKGILGLRSDAPIIRGLNDVINGTGQKLSSEMLTPGLLRMMAPPQQPTGPNLFGPGPAQPTPPTPQPKLPLGSAADFYKAVIPEMNQSSLLDRVLSTMFDKKKGESVASAIARTSINRAAPLHNLDQMNAANGYTGRSAGKAMEISLTNTGRIAQLFTTGMGKVNPNTGEINLRNDVKPLLQIMKEAGADNEDNKKGLQVYLAALRERDLRKSGRQGFTQIPDGAVLDAIQQAEAAHPEWKQTAADLDKLNNALIDWSLDTGIIGADQAQNLRDVFYTPFYRVMEKNTMEDPARAVSPKIGESFTNVASAINRELKGGESPLGDLLTNIVLNADSIMKAGLKNLSMRTSAEAMDFANLAQKNLTGKKNENTITFKVDGKDVSYDVDDPVLFSALAGMPRNMQNGIYNTMARMASVFRDFVTVAPSFIMANLYKGKITAYVQEGQPFFTNTFAGMRDALNASTSLQNFQLQTGFGGMEYGMESRNMAKAFERKLSDKGVMKALSQGKVLSAMRQSFDKMQALSEASEMAERIKLAENLIKKGMDPKEAYFQAYLLAPYSRRGTGEGWVGSTLQFFMPLVPFLNAKLQTTYRLVENEKGDKRRLWTLGLPQQIFLRGLVVTAFSLLAYGLNLADDEEKWDKIPNYMKLNYDIIPFMGNYITLPRAFEVGQVFGAIPVFMIDAIRRGEGKDLAEALVEVGKNTFFMSLMPKAVDPLIGAVTNYDFFRMRPLETKGEQALPSGERVNRSTTKTGEALSSVVNMVFGDILSPIKAQALLDGYSGTLGVTLMNGFDSILAMLGAIPGKPAGAFGDPATMPAALANAAGFNRFYREDETMVSRFVGDFYKVKEMTDQLVRSQNLARQNGDFERLQELRGTKGLPLRMREVVNSASTQIADINKRIRIIERRDIDGVAKAEAIRPLIAQRDRIAKRVVDRARAIGAL